MGSALSSEEPAMAPQQADAPQTSSIHDTPIVGHFTLFFADSFGKTFGFNNMTEEELKKAFDDIDTDKSNSLSKTEITDALRKLNKSENEIQTLIDGMEGEEELNFEQFKALVQGKAQPYTTSVGVAGIDIPLPNLAKVHDIPILGAFSKASQDLVTNMSWSLMGVAFGAAFGKMTDAQLKAKFDEIDEDKSGSLNASEISKALRALKVNEKDIKAMTDQVGNKELNFTEFKALVKPEGDGASVHDTPVVGHFTTFFTDSFSGTFGLNKMSDEELKAAFDSYDTDKSGTLDKAEITQALKMLGKPDKDIKKLTDSMEADSISFEEFKALIEGKARQYTTSVGVAGVDVTIPNLQKIHDIPILGALTGATQDLFTNVSLGLMGVALSAAYGNLSDKELQDKFNEIDADKSGKLNANEIGKALQDLNMSKADIKAITDKVGTKELDFEEFKKLVKGD